MQEERELRRRLPSWNRILDVAVVKTFGQDILVKPRDKIKMREYLKNKFLTKLEFEVEHCSPEPILRQPCIIDVTNKEFFNQGEVETVETVIQNYKNSTLGFGSKYRYKVTDGVRFNDFKLGYQIVSLSMTGGSMMLQSDDSEGTVKKVRTTSRFESTKDLIHWQVYNQDLMIHYDHKEKLSVPPMTKVTAMVTTISKRSEQEYTLRFRCSKDEIIPVTYYNRCQRICSFFNKLCCGCCCGPTKGVLFAKDLLQGLPDFEQDDRYCWFTSKGTLIWLGEACTVKISQESLIQPQ